MGSKSGGYTIIEVMIFLAVSGFMFLLAAVFIQNKQTGVQFRQGMNSISTEVQQVINDVGDNNYQLANITCTPNGAGSNVGIASAPGQSDTLGCTYLGKVVQFGLGTLKQNYDVYTIAGCQYSNCPSAPSGGISSLLPPGGFSDSGATAVDPDNTYTCSNTPGITVAINLTTCNEIQWGLYVTAMYNDSGNPSGSNVPTTSSIGFFASFAQQNGGGLAPGNQTVDVVDTSFGSASIGSSNNNEEGMTTLLNQDLKSASTIANPYFVVCLADGHGNAGALTIGGGSGSGINGQRLTTSIQVSNGPIKIFGGKETCTT